MHPFKASAVALLALALGACSSSTQLDSIEAQLADLQRQMLVMQREAATAAALDATGERLNGQLAGVVETQADVREEVGGLAEQVERLDAGLEDLRFRLSQISQQLAAASDKLEEVRIAPVARPDAGLDPQALYRAAYDDYLRGNFDLAILAFTQYLERYAATDLADNAAYWIGECYYRLSRFRDAVTAFDRVLTNFPRSDKIASTLLKRGYAYLELGDRAQGIVNLQGVAREHPTSDEANLAKQRLTALGVDSPGSTR
jgi:tol-pal system protein YbgF